MSLVRLVIAAWLLTVTTRIWAEGLPPDVEVIPVKNGITSFNAGSDNLMVVLGHRENFNAHSSEVASFYLRTKAVDADPDLWQFVPIERKSEEGKWQENVRVWGGVDCHLETFRLLWNEKLTVLHLLIATREFGHTFLDPASVTFEYYQLTFNHEGIPGWPVAYFKRSRTEKAKSPYCDVDDAIKTELGLEGAIAPIE